MTQPLAIPQRQVTAICRGAAKAGFVAEVKIGEVVVRLIPEDRAQAAAQFDIPETPEACTTLDEYRAWRDRSRAGEDQGHS